MTREIPLSVCRALVVSLGTLLIACSRQQPASVPEKGAEDVPWTQESQKAFRAPREWSPAELVILDAAIARAQAITADTEFLAIVRESDAAGEIEWKADNFENLPDSAHSAPTEWTLQRFAAAGHFRASDIQVGDWEFNPAEDLVTRAKTTPCARLSQLCTTFHTTFHPSIVRSNSEIALANTVVHERVHAFGQKHISNKRSKNLCEAPSVIGDIAESLMVRRQQQGPITPRQKLCPKLDKRLRDRGVVS